MYIFTNLTSCEPLSAPLWRHQAPDKPVVRVPHAVHLVLCSAKESSWASHTSSLFLNNSTSPGFGHSPHKMMEFPAPPASSPCPPTQEGSALWHRSSRGHSCFSDASFLRIHSAPWHLTPPTMAEPQGRKDNCQARQNARSCPGIPKKGHLQCPGIARSHSRLSGFLHAELTTDPHINVNTANHTLQMYY